MHAKTNGSSQAFFITATGTGIGKTFVTALLTHQLRQQGIAVKALKPVISGWDASDYSLDTYQLLEAAGIAADNSAVDAVSPFRFSMPISPDLAAEREGKPLAFDTVLAWTKKNIAADGVTFIEGAGGVAVPLEKRNTMADLAAALSCRTILIAGTYLGAISHTLTSIHYLEHKGIKPAAIILNASKISAVEPQELVKRMAVHTDYPLFYLPRVKNLHENNTRIWQSALEIPEGLIKVLLHG